jgi:hypothetical protein
MRTTHPLHAHTQVLLTSIPPPTSSSYLPSSRDPIPRAIPSRDLTMFCCRRVPTFIARGDHQALAAISLSVFDVFFLSRLYLSLAIADLGFRNTNNLILRTPVYYKTFFILVRRPGVFGSGCTDLFNHGSFVVWGEGHVYYTRERERRRTYRSDFCAHVDSKVTNTNSVQTCQAKTIIHICFAELVCVIYSFRFHCTNSTLELSSHIKYSTYTHPTTPICAFIYRRLRYQLNAN